MGEVAIPEAAQALIGRLAAVDYSTTISIDRPRVEAALRRHLADLGLPDRPVVWCEGFGAGFKRILDAARAAAWDAAWDAARAAAWDAAWDAARAAARAAARDAARDAARAAARAAARDAAWDAFDHIQWLSWCALKPSPDDRVVRYAAMLAPLFEAWEAGAWAYWITPREIIVVPRPVLRLDTQNRLHADAAAAVEWPDQERYWFWHGVRVPQEVVERPADITVGGIDKERNAEVRRVMVERYGTSRYLVDGGAEELDRDQDTLGNPIVLYRKPVPDDEPIVMVKVINSTPEPEGHSKEYFLRVPPDQRRAMDALGWTFGLDGKDYRPEIET